MSLKINLKKVSNGVIKTSVDSNSNGAGEERKETKVYDFTDDEGQGFKNALNFINDILADLQIDIKGKNRGLVINMLDHSDKNKVESDNDQS